MRLSLSLSLTTSQKVTVGEYVVEIERLRVKMLYLHMIFIYASHTIGTQIPLFLQQ